MRGRDPPSTPPRGPARLSVVLNGKLYSSGGMDMQDVDASELLGEPDELPGERALLESDKKRRGLVRQIREEEAIEGEPVRKKLFGKATEDIKPVIGVKSRTGKGATTATATARARVPSASGLPNELERLLSLHSAVEQTLLFHFSSSASTAGSALASYSVGSPSGTGDMADGEQTEVHLPALIDLPKLSRNLAGAGRKFGTKELSELCWLWGGCVEQPHPASPEGPPAAEFSGMGFCVSSMRVLDPATRRPTRTWGLGLRFALSANPGARQPAFELVGDAAGSPKSKGKCKEKARGVDVLPAWMGGMDGRKREARKRAEGWWEQQQLKASKRKARAFLPTPPNSNTKRKAAEVSLSSSDEADSDEEEDARFRQIRAASPLGSRSAGPSSKGKGKAATPLTPVVKGKAAAKKRRIVPSPESESDASSDNEHGDEHDDVQDDVQDAAEDESRLKLPRIELPPLISPSSGPITPTQQSPSSSAALRGLREPGSPTPGGMSLAQAQLLGFNPPAPRALGAAPRHDGGSDGVAKAPANSAKSRAAALLERIKAKEAAAAATAAALTPAGLGADEQILGEDADTRRRREELLNWGSNTRRR